MNNVDDAGLAAGATRDTPLVQTYARAAGLLALISVIAGAFGEAYVPMQLLVPADADATASNFVQHNALARLGFAAYLVEGLCDVGLALLLYALLRPVHRDVALLATFFRLIGTTGFAVAQLFHFTAVAIANRPAGLQGLAPDQLNVLALQSVHLGQYGATLFMMFYGAGFILTGWLMMRARYLPTFLGVLMLITGAGFLTRTFLWVLAPAYASPLLLAPAALAGLALSLWLLIKGVDVARWNEEAAAPRSRSL